MSVNNGAYWLTVAPSDAPSKLANRIVADHGNPFPVPVSDFLEELADIREDKWNNPCDALTVGLQSPRPTVYLKAGTFGPRRRFTMAHEIGHIAIPWHLGVDAGCDIDSLIDEPVDQPVRSPVLQQEQEAQLFAGALLLPYEAVRERFSSLPADEALTELAKAGMSATAFTIRIARYLLPGFLLCAERSISFDPLVIASSGSDLHGINLGNASEYADESGTLEVSGKTVRWFRFLKEDKVPDYHDERSTSDLLTSAIMAAGVTDKQEVRSVFQRINGIVAGKLSAHRTDSPHAMFSILKHRFQFNSADLRPVVDTSDFELYLWRKASERANSLARKALSRG